MPSHSKDDPLLDSLVEGIRDDIDEGAVNHLLRAKPNAIKSVTTGPVNTSTAESERREKHEKVITEAEALKTEIALRKARIDALNTEIGEQQKKLTDIENQARKYGVMGMTFESRAQVFETELEELNLQIAEHENKHKERDRLIYGSNRPVEEIVNDIKQNEALLLTSGIEHGRYRIIKDRIFRLKRELDIAQSPSIHHRTVFDVDEFELLKDKLPELKNKASETSKKISETIDAIKQYQELYAKCLQEAENLRLVMSRSQEEMAMLNKDTGAYQKQLIELLNNLETIDKEISGLNGTNNKAASRLSSAPEARYSPLQVSSKTKNVFTDAQSEDSPEVTELKNRLEESKSKVDALTRRKNDCIQQAKNERGAGETFRKIRDEQNQQVRSLKEKRDALNKQANETSAKIRELYNSDEVNSGRSLNELRKELDHLEFKQQTEVLTTEKERLLFDKISELKDEFRLKKNQLDNRHEIREQTAAVKELRAEATEIHNRVKSIADQAEEYHDKMRNCFKEEERLKAEADAINKELIQAQDKADECNRKLNNLLKQVNGHVIQW